MGRIRSTVVAGVAAASAVIMVAGTASAAGTPGGGSIGDAYYPSDGNTGYDIGHYDLRLNYTPGADQLSGTATILLTPTKDLSSFSLDFRLPASSVLANNATAKFTSQTGTDHGKLQITPAATLAKDQPVTLVIRYAGVPSKAAYFGQHLWVADAQGGLGAQEPQICSLWYPCNEHPLDKATYDISVAVPTGTQVVSNGTLTGTSSPIKGITRFNWRSTTPRATYLSLMAIGKYEVRQQTAPDGRPFITAYDTRLDPSTGDAARASVERTPEILAFEQTNFGPYPFEAEGGVVSPQLGFSLETQTRPIYGAKNFLKGANTSLIAHENAHQWFGDDVSVHGWRDIFDNEGFATYAQWLWSDHEGEGTAQQVMDATYDSYAASDPAWNLLPADPGAEHQFDDLPVYDRGAMTLQALRNTVGDAKFFAILRGWPTQHPYGNATVEQFTAYAQQVAGKDLSKLFKVWLYTKGKPARTVANGFPPAASAGRGVAPAAAPTAVPRSFAQIHSTVEMLAAQHG